MISIPSNLLPLLAQFPAELQEKIIHGWSQPRSIISFRVNHLKSSTEEVIQSLKEVSLPYQTHIFSTETPLNPPLSRGLDIDVFFLPIDQEYTLR